MPDSELIFAVQQNKQRLAAYISYSQERQVNPNALFDVQVKRIHEVSFDVRLLQ